MSVQSSQLLGHIHPTLAYLVSKHQDGERLKFNISKWGPTA